MKKDKKYLILVVVLAIILITALILRLTRNKENQTANQPENITIAGAQTQTYVTNQVPVFKEDDKFFGEETTIKIFVYEDYTNIYSANLADTLERLRQENSEKITLIIRPFILENSPLAKMAAVAVECAAEKGKWKEMRALLFTNVKNNQLAADNFSTYARNLGLDENDFLACLTNSQKSEKIEQSQLEAASYSVLGAPTMFINNEMILGARPYEDYVDSNGDKIEGLKTVVEGKLKN